MADELNNIQDMEPVEDMTKVLIGIRKKNDGTKLAVTIEQYSGYDKRSWAADGIIIRDEDNDADLLFAGYEATATFGEGPADIPETDKRRRNAPASPSFYELDGERRTKWQLDNHPDTHEDGCAICEAVKFGWLPSNGEMDYALSRLERFNETAQACGAQPLEGTSYWCSTQYDPDYMWCKNMESGNFEFWHSKTTEMSIRPVRSASEYQELVG